MNPIDGAARLLERLRHHEILDVVDTHSRGGILGRDVKEWHFAQYLGARRLWNFRGLHRDALLEAAAKLRGSGAEPLAYRGRLLRLAGDERGPAALERSLKLKVSSRAAGWLGESLIAASPKRARSLLDRAIELDAYWPWPLLWRAVLRLRLGEASAAQSDAEHHLELRERSGEASPFLGHLVRAQCRLEAEDFAGAERAATQAARCNPAAAGGWHMAGYSRCLGGDWSGALALADEARNRDPDIESPYLFRRFGVLLEWHRPEAYLKALDEAIAREPGAGVLFAARAELLRDPRLCRYEEALRDYQTAVRLAPSCAWALAVLGRAQDYSGDSQSALATFDRAAERAPYSGWIRAWRGALLTRLGRTDDAARDFDEAVERMPWYSFSYAWRGALRNRVGRPAEAERDLDIAIRLDPHYVFSSHERFLARRALGRWTGAVSDINHAFRCDPKYTWLGNSARSLEPEAVGRRLAELDGAVRRNPRLAWLRAWRGHSLLRLGRPADALEDLDAASRLAPGEALIRSWRGWALRDCGDSKAALPELRRAAKLDPKDWIAWQLLAELHEAEGRLGAALEAAERVVELTPTTVSALLRKARLALRLGRLDDAQAAAARAEQLDPRFADVAVLAAQIRLEKGDVLGALAAAEKALRTPAPPAMAYLVRGMAHRGLGDLEAQLADFRRAFELDPGLFPEKERRLLESLTPARGGA